jgi:pSer/pThr/pTyr-binding forkhead associated (FHA) protein
MSTSPSSNQPEKAAPPVEGTRLESAEEIRRALQARRSPTVKEAPPEADTPTFRPTHRPPMALLCILDDGRDEGEWVRVRSDRLTIGRTEGDIVIPHDAMISGRHAELTRQLDQGRFRWHLTDLQSTNGTYVRVNNAPLKHQQELLLGSRRYRFDAVPQGVALAAAGETGEEKPSGTRGWQNLAPTTLFPSLIELTPQGEGPRLLLTKADQTVGRQAGTCAIVLANDPLVSPQHARIYRDAKDRWHIENTRSLNGIWLRIDRMPLDSACQFQLGEQRFLFKVL